MSAVVDSAYIHCSAAHFPDRHRARLALIPYTRPAETWRDTMRSAAPLVRRAAGPWRVGPSNALYSHALFETPSDNTARTQTGLAEIPHCCSSPADLGVHNLSAVLAPWDEPYPRPRAAHKYASWSTHRHPPLSSSASRTWTVERPLYPLASARVGRLFHYASPLRIPARLPREQSIASTPASSRAGGCVLHVGRVGAASAGPRATDP